uniref:Uncharacterized protein n=1 Tax=Thermofilum adornatum TaxID=1365176 RepID=A0A7C1GJS6_9CREN
MTVYINAIIAYEVLGYIFIVFSMIFSVVLALASAPLTDYITSFKREIARDMLIVVFYLLPADIILTRLGVYYKEKRVNKLWIYVSVLITGIAGFLGGDVILNNQILNGFFARLQSIYYFFTLIFLYLPKIPVECIWYDNIGSKIYFANLSDQDRVINIFYRHLSYTFILFVVYILFYFLVSLYPIFGSLNALIKVLSAVITLFIVPLANLIITTVLKSDSFSTNKFLTVYLENKNGYFSLFVSNISSTFFYEIFVDNFPSALKGILKENGIHTVEAPISVLEPGSRKEIAIFDANKYHEYFEKNNLDYEFIRIYYRDIAGNWYVLYVKLGKDYAVPLISTIKKINLITFFKESVKFIVHSI